MIQRSGEIIIFEGLSDFPLYNGIVDYDSIITNIINNYFPCKCIDDIQISSRTQDDAIKSFYVKITFDYTHKDIYRDKMLYGESVIADEISFAGKLFQCSVSNVFGSIDFYKYNVENLL